MQSIDDMVNYLRNQGTISLQNTPCHQYLNSKAIKTSLNALLNCIDQPTRAKMTHFSILLKEFPCIEVRSTNSF